MFGQRITLKCEIIEKMSLAIVQFAGERKFGNLKEKWNLHNWRYIHKYMCVRVKVDIITGIIYTGYCPWTKPVVVQWFVYTSHYVLSASTLGELSPTQKQVVWLRNYNNTLHTSSTRPTYYLAEFLGIVSSKLHGYGVKKCDEFTFLIFPRLKVCQRKRTNFGWLSKWMQLE